MRIHFTRLLALLPLAFLGACATTFPPHAYLPAETHDKIAATEVIVPVRQSEMYVYVPPSTAGGSAGAAFGILGALAGAIVDSSVNSIRTSKAEASVKPLRDAMVDYNFDTTLQTDLKTSLATAPWLGANDVRGVREVTPDALDLALANSKAGAVLFVTTDYHLDNDGNVLTVTAQASLFPNNDALRAFVSAKARGPKTALPNSIYHNTLTYETRVAGGTDNRDANMATWSASSGAAMRSALSVGAKELAQMLAVDLQRTDDTIASDAAAITVDGQAGHVVATDADGTAIRFPDGTLKFATKSIL